MTFINSSNDNNKNESEDKDSITSGVEIIATINLNQDNGVFQNTEDDDEENKDEECDSSRDQASKAKTFFGVDIACGSCSRKNIVLGALAGGLFLLVLVSGTSGMMVQSKVDQQLISSSAAAVAAAKAPKAKATKAPKGGGGGDTTLSPTSKPTNSPTTGCDPNHPLSCFEFAGPGYCRDAQNNSYSHVAFVAPLDDAGAYGVGNVARICFECVRDEVPAGTLRGFEYTLDPPVGYCLYDYDSGFDYTVTGTCNDSCSDCSNRGIDFLSSDNSLSGSGNITQSDGTDWMEAICFRLKE